MSTRTPPTAVALLDRALAYAHDCLQQARTSPPDLPTPCAGWPLAALLLHLEDSLLAITEAAGGGHVHLAAPGAPPTGPLPEHPLGPPLGALVDRVGQRTCAASTAWHEHLSSAPVPVGDLWLARDILLGVGALETAVHGWDVARATGSVRALPEALAARLYPVALVAVTPGTRAQRFAAAVPVPAAASYADRLLGHLGRRPGPGCRPV